MKPLNLEQGRKVLQVINDLERAIDSMTELEATLGTETFTTIGNLPPEEMEKAFESMAQGRAFKRKFLKIQAEMEKH